jgi:hypothetical protein
VKFRRIDEKCIYFSDLDIMKDFYVDKTGLNSYEKKEDAMFS